MPKKKPYYHNNWQTIKDTPDEYFGLPHGTLTFDEFMDWKVGGWELPSSCNYLIRECNLTTGKVKEYAYQYPGAAQKKLRQRMESGDCEFVVADHDAVHILRPNYEEDYDDPLA